MMKNKSESNVDEIYVLHYEGKLYKDAETNSRKLRVYCTENMAWGYAKSIAKSNSWVNFDKFEVVTYTPKSQGGKENE